MTRKYPAMSSWAGATTQAGDTSPCTTIVEDAPGNCRKTSG
ncbi:hypothetical protein RCH22_002743 [Cryobacterium psychrotolerans]|nr:hypothetical protein [Cryobacterium psychrotolerans]